MSSFMTNRGAKVLLNIALRADATDTPAQWKLRLCTGAQTPTVDTNLVTELTEIAAGNGYSAGGIVIERSAVGFDLLTEDDILNLAFIQMKDGIFTATGGPLPASGDPARWGILNNDKATPEVIFVFDLEGDRVVSSGQPLKVEDAEISFEQPAA